MISVSLMQANYRVKKSHMQKDPMSVASVVSVTPSKVSLHAMKEYTQTGGTMNVVIVAGALLMQDS